MKGKFLLKRTNDWREGERERENYQRSIKFNETVAHCFLGLRINRHPQPIVLNQTNLTVDFTNNTF